MTHASIATTPLASAPPATSGAAPALDLDHLVHAQIAR